MQYFLLSIFGYRPRAKPRKRLSVIENFIDKPVVQRVLGGEIIISVGIVFDLLHGFAGKLKSGEENSTAYLDEIQPQDLTKFGLIPEFVGRMPIVVGLQPLDETALVKIMTEPKNAIVKQYKKLVGIDDVELVVTDDAVSEVAKKAIELKTGARGLRTIFENLMLDSMYDIPSEDDVEKVIIDKDVVLGKKGPEIIKKSIA